MKKNKILTAISLSVILISAVFTVSCELFGTVNSVVLGVPVNFRWRDSKPPASVKSASRAVMDGATTDDASYAPFVTYYNDTLGGNSKIVQKITPDKFLVYQPVIAAAVDGETHIIVDKDDWSELIQIDLKKSTTVEMPSGIPAGIKATGIIIRYQWYAFSIEGDPHMFPPPTTTFTVTTPIHSDHPWVADNLGGIPIMTPIGTTTNGGKTITIPTSVIFPDKALNDTGIVGPMEKHFVYTGTVYKYETQFTGDFSHWGGHGGFVTPWAGYTTTNKPIIFNVNWDVTDLIEQRCATYNGSGDHACASCVYVLADKFWERFSFTVE